MSRQMVRNPFFEGVIYIIIFIWFLLVALPLQAGAAEDSHGETGFSMGLNTVVIPFISGTAGNGPGAPEYDDLFGTGRSFALEAEKRINNHVSLIAGVGYEKYPGETFQGMSFDDLEIIPFSAGCRFHLLTNSPLQASVGARIGLTYISSVNVSWNSLKGNYWNSSWVPAGDIDLVLGRRINNWNFSAGVSIRYTGAPDNDFPAAEADGFWTVPLQFNISYCF